MARANTDAFSAMVLEADGRTLHLAWLPLRESQLLAGITASWGSSAGSLLDADAARAWLGAIRSRANLLEGGFDFVASSRGEPYRRGFDLSIGGEDPMASMTVFIEDDHLRELGAFLEARLGAPVPEPGEDGP